MEPVHLICSHHAFCRDWPWHCRVKIDAVAKFDQYTLDPVLRIISESSGELLEALFGPFLAIMGMLQFWIF